MTFLDCLKHFISEKGENHIEELDGLELFNDFKNNPIELKKRRIDIDNKDYIINLEYHFKNYEYILNGKSQEIEKNMVIVI